MGEPACLHVQDRAWGPIRVVEIPWISVRVGRSARCEVRLSDPALPREVCRLERRSGEWRITPLGRECVIELGNRPLDCACPLPFDLPFRVGSYVLTLRRDRASQPDWAMHEMRIPPALAAARADFAHASFATPDPPVSVAAPKPPVASSPSWVRETDRWANRWREAGASLEKRDRPNRSNRPREPIATETATRAPKRVDEIVNHVDQALDVEPPVAPAIEIPRVETLVVAEPVEASPISESLLLLETPFLIEPSEAVPKDHIVEPTVDEPDPVALGPEPVAFEPDPIVLEPEPSLPEPVLAAVDSRDASEEIGRLEPEGEPRADREWPRASEVLASYARERRAAMASGSSRAGVKRPMPTVLREPETWALPIWLAGPVMVGLLLLLGLGGGALAIEWALDSAAAGLTAGRLFAPPARLTPLPDAASPPGTRWFQTTGRHLAHHALAIAGADQASDLARRGLEQALAVAPIEPEARLALARLAPEEKSVGVAASDLGLIRESLALATSAQRLAEAGNKPAALGLYRQALLQANRPGLAVQGAPAFSEDAGAERYLAPGEERVRAILLAMTAEKSWKPEDWLAIVPERGLVELATARLLVERGSDLGRPILERLAAESPDDDASMLDHAIQGEACALAARWDLADRAYRRAIEAAPEGVVKRALWFNLADVASRLDDEGRRQSALKAATLAAGGDEVSRRATLARRGSGIDRSRAETSPRAN